MATVVPDIHHDRGFATATIAPSRTNTAAPLNVSRILRDAALIVALLLLNKGGTTGASVFFAVLVVMLFRSPKSAFQSLAICYLGLMINQFFVPKTLAWTPGRLILPFLAFIRFSADLVAMRTALIGRSWYLAFLLFIATMTVGSVISGWFTQIALLKLFNFWAVITAIMSGVLVLRTKRIDISEWFVSLVFAATAFGFGSLALGVSRNFRQITTSTGENLQATGFNGAFLHPNLHATYATLFVTYLLLIWILGGYRKTWLAVPGIASWFLFMSWSGSRTSIIASFLGAMLLIAYARPALNRQGWVLRPNIKRGNLVALLAIAVAGVAAWDTATSGSIRKSVVQFINKGESGVGAEGFDTTQIMASRKSLIELSWKNFQENSLFGIGFGVAKTEVFARTATLMTAPAEKGFLPTALLEEGGVMGAAAFVLFVLMFIRQMVLERNVAGLVTLVAFVATNLGEVTIFSPGGAGSFGWITVGAAMILGDHCWTPPAPWQRPGLSYGRTT
jgi:hypothetical protein